MGVIRLSTFVKQGCVALVVGLVTLVEVLGGCRHINERHTQLCSQLLHLVAIVHRVVVGGELLSCLEHTVDDGVILICQVVLSGFGDGCYSVGEIAAAHRRYEDRDRPLGLHGIDDIRQTRFVRRRGGCSSSVALHGSGIGSIALVGIVLLELQVVDTIVLTVIVGKLDEHIVARLHSLLGILP